VVGRVEEQHGELVLRRQHGLLAAGQRAQARVVGEGAVVAQDCVGIGVAAIVVLRSAADSLQSALTSESRFLMAADVTVSTGEGFTGETEVIFDDVASGHPLTGVSRSVQIATLARAADDPLVAGGVDTHGVCLRCLLPPWPSVLREQNGCR